MSAGTETSGNPLNERNTINTREIPFPRGEPPRPRRVPAASAHLRAALLSSRRFSRPRYTAQPRTAQPLGPPNENAGDTEATAASAAAAPLRLRGTLSDAATLSPYSGERFPRAPGNPADARLSQVRNALGAATRVRGTAPFAILRDKKLRECTLFYHHEMCGMPIFFFFCTQLNSIFIACTPFRVFTFVYGITSGFKIISFGFIRFLSLFSLYPFRFLFFFNYFEG